MKKYIVLLMTAAMLAVTVLSGCRRATHNGKIDGLWKVVEIETFPDGGTSEVTNPENVFFGVQLELFQIDTPTPRFTGEMTFGKDRQLSVRFTDNTESDELRQFGIYSNPVTFTIETLNSKHLVLSTPSSVITCRRF